MNKETDAYAVALENNEIKCLFNIILRLIKVYECSQDEGATILTGPEVKNL